LHISSVGPEILVKPDKVNFEAKVKDFKAIDESKLATAVQAIEQDNDIVLQSVDDNMDQIEEIKEIQTIVKSDGKLNDQ
jgi:hypothetical protein